MNFGKFKEISFIGSADVIGTAITSIFWLFLASQISPEEYGEIFYFIGAAAMVSAFVLIGTQNSVTVYSSKNIPLQSTLYFLSLVFGIIGSFVLIFIFYKIDIILLLFGYIINSLAVGELLGKKNFLGYSKFTLIQKILTLSIGLLFLLIFGSEGIIFALATSYIFFSIIIYKGLKNSNLDFSLLKKHSRFVLNNYFIEILTKSNAHLNKFIIVPILGFGVLGNFSLAVQLTHVGLIFTLIVFKYTIPFDSRGDENQKLKKFTLLISIIIALLGAFVAPVVVPVLFPQYVEVIDVVRIISFTIIPLTVTKIFTSKLLGQEKSKQILFSKIISMIAFIIAILVLSESYGIIGISVGYLLSTIIESLCLIPRKK